MKRINLLFWLLISLNLYSQNEKNTITLIEVFKELPDEFFTHQYGKITTEKRNSVLNNYMQNKKSDTLINFIRFDSFYGDIGLEYEIKLFQNVVAFRVQYSTHLTTEPGRIEFYSYKNKTFKNITHKVLTSFDYRKDNYNKSIIESLVKIYPHSIKKEEANKMLLYYFSGNDTVEIIDNFELHYENCNVEAGLDEKFSTLGLFTKKYIMKKGKFKLVE